MIKTTSLKLEEGWYVNRHTGTSWGLGEWYSLSHSDKNHDAVDANYSTSMHKHVCNKCNTPVPDNVLGFFKLCMWEV